MRRFGESGKLSGGLEVWGVESKIMMSFSSSTLPSLPSGWLFGVKNPSSSSLSLMIQVMVPGSFGGEVFRRSWACVPLK